MDIINKSVSIRQLLLDPNNLRLDYGVTDTKIDESQYISLQLDTLSKLEEENVEEIRQSILDNGFIEIDRVVVRRSKLMNGSLPYYVVIEGNRRTAALKTIYDDYIKKGTKVSDELEKQFDAINVCLINSDDEQKVLILSASLMGIRHVSGPKKWKGVQAAKLIHQLKQNGKSFKDIGHLLGIDETDAKRRHDGFLAFCQMKDDIVFGDKCNYNHYALLLEFITNKHSSGWLKWNGAKFAHKLTRDILYGHLTKNAGQKRAEINNTSDARMFNRYLAIPNYATELAAGKKKMSELPELPKDHSSKVVYISRFRAFLENLDSEYTELQDVNAELKEIAKILNTTLTDAKD